MNMSNKERKYDIFISYRREDGAQYARILQLELEKRHFKVFLDYEELTDGVFGDNIKEAIADAPVFIMVLTPLYLQRTMEENSWVREEIEMAVSCQKHFVPVDPDRRFNGLPEGTPSSIAHVVGDYQHSVIDFGQTLGVTIDLMVKNRIAPYITETKSSETKQGRKWLGLLLGLALLAVVAVGAYMTFGSKTADSPAFSKVYSDALCEAANNGDKLAQYYLGLVYENGYGTAVDKGKAVVWYEKAAAQDVDSAQVCLANCYFEGAGVEKNDSTAVYWLYSAVGLGNSDAMVNLGAYYYNNDKEAEGKRWLQKAIEEGNENAKRILARLAGETE
jgi:hypothetical protein